MPFGIIRSSKITSYAGLVGVSMHNNREREVTNADRSKADLNIFRGAKDHKEMLLSARKIHDTVDRKIQKNAVLAVEYLITASHDFFESRSFEDGKKFFNTALQHLQKKHGNENVVSVAVHYDERTPHMHVVVIPVLKKEKKVTNPVTKETRTKEVISLDAGNWLGGFTKMKKLQNEFFEEVSKPFGLERGNEKAKATHIDIARWYAIKHAEEADQKTKKLEEKTVSTDKNRSKDIDKKTHEMLREMAKDYGMTVDESYGPWEIAKLIVEAETKDLRSDYKMSEEEMRESMQAIIEQAQLTVKATEEFQTKEAPKEVQKPRDNDYSR